MEMDQARRNELFYRIVSGEQKIKVGKQSYVLPPPSIPIKARAEEFYRECLEENKFGDWLTDSQCIAILVKSGQANPTIEEDLKKSEEAVENCKVTLYDSYVRKFKLDQARKFLELAKKKNIDLFNLRHSYDHFTLKHFADNCKYQYILANTLLTDNGDRVWPSLDETDLVLLNKIVGKIIEESVNIAELRYMARNDPWRHCWNIDKERIFAKPAYELTEEQKLIISFSQRYDSASEHPERPTKAVMDDDDLFDGWNLTQVRLAEKSTNRNEMENRLSGKMKDAGEVFILAHDKDDAQRINALNDTDAQMTKQQRMKTIEKKGIVKEAEFLDTKLELQRKSNEKFKNVGKKG